MATCDPGTLATRGSCFFCLPPGFNYPIKLALLALIAKKKNPALDTSPGALLANGSCFACLPGSEAFVTAKLSLLCNIRLILEPPPVPLFNIPYDNGVGYTIPSFVNGLNGGVNGTNPAFIWNGPYAARDEGVVVWDNFNNYPDGVSVNGLNGGVNGTGQWNGAYAGR